MNIAIIEPIKRQDKLQAYLDIFHINTDKEIKEFITLHTTAWVILDILYTISKKDSRTGLKRLTKKDLMVTMNMLPDMYIKEHIQVSPYFGSQINSTFIQWDLNMLVEAELIDYSKSSLLGFLPLVGSYFRTYSITLKGSRFIECKDNATKLDDSFMNMWLRPIWIIP